MTCLRLALLLAGLLVPGAALLRALRLPRSVGACFAASAIVLYGCALALNALGLPLSLPSLATALAAATGAACAATGRSPNRIGLGLGTGSMRAHGEGDADAGALAPFTGLGTLAPFMLLYWAVIGFLLLREPLAGPDVHFRWAFLPEQWLRRGSLDFYPPLSASDFTSYFWVESIPPGVAALHAWAFACAGSFAPAWMIPVTALQFASLHDLAWRAGAAAGGGRAARPAAVLVAACPLLNWSCRLGQESGLTTLAALGLLLALLRWRATARPAWAAAAGLFAVLGAMTREYGLVYPAFAAAALAAAGRAPRAAWRAFALAALPLCLAWPLRCALRTGNPFYSLDVAGLFPTNQVFVAWVADHRAIFGALFAEAGGWLYALRWFALGAAPALVGWIALLAFAPRRRAAALGAAAFLGFLGLWLLSVPYTTGGPFYSLRVSSPALAIGAVAAGALAARRGGAGGVRAGFLGVLLLATLPFTLLLPHNPVLTPLRDWPAPWRPAPPPAFTGPAQIIPAILAGCGPASVILTDSPGFQPLLAPYGVRAIPVWSPQAAWLFDPQTGPAEAARRWRESGLHLLVLSKFIPAVDFINRRARWNSGLFRMRLVGDAGGFIALQVDAGPPPPEPAPLTAR